MYVVRKDRRLNICPYRAQCVLLLTIEDNCLSTVTTYSATTHPLDMMIGGSGLEHRPDPVRRRGLHDPVRQGGPLRNAREVDAAHVGQHRGDPVWTCRPRVVRAYLSLSIDKHIYNLKSTGSIASLCSCPRAVLHVHSYTHVS